MVICLMLGAVVMVKETNVNWKQEKNSNLLLSSALSVKIRIKHPLTSFFILDTQKSQLWMQEVFIISMAMYVFMVIICLLRQSS